MSPVDVVTPGALSASMQDIARRYVAARRKSGEGTLEAASAMAEARAQAAHGEWGLFLEATGTSESTAGRLLAIAQEAAQNPTYRQRILDGWLGASTAALIAQAEQPSAVLERLLLEESPPSVADVRTAASPKSSKLEDLPSVGDKVQTSGGTVGTVYRTKNGAIDLVTNGGVPVTALAIDCTIVSRRPRALVDLLRAAISGGDHRRKEADVLLGALPPAEQDMWRAQQANIDQANAALVARRPEEAWHALQWLQDPELKEMMLQLAAGAARELRLSWPPVEEPGDSPEEPADWRAFADRGIAPHTPPERIPADWDAWRDKARALPGGDLQMTQQGIVTLLVNGVVSVRKPADPFWSDLCDRISIHAARYQPQPATLERDALTSSEIVALMGHGWRQVSSSLLPTSTQYTARVEGQGHLTLDAAGWRAWLARQTPAPAPKPAVPAHDPERLADLIARAADAGHAVGVEPGGRIYWAGGDCETLDALSYTVLTWERTKAYQDQQQQQAAAHDAHYIPIEQRLIAWLPTLDRQDRRALAVATGYEPTGDEDDDEAIDRWTFDFLSEGLKMASVADLAWVREPVAATETPARTANALPPLTAPNWDRPETRLDFAQIQTWIAALETGTATATEAQLEHLADQLEFLSDDATIDDAAFEAAQQAIDTLVDRLTARAAL